MALHSSIGLVASVKTAEAGTERGVHLLSGLVGRPDGAKANRRLISLQKLAKAVGVVLRHRRKEDGTVLWDVAWWRMLDF